METAFTGAKSIKNAEPVHGAGGHEEPLDAVKCYWGQRGSLGLEERERGKRRKRRRVVSEHSELGGAIWAAAPAVSAAGGPSA
jgi:hypothetical protein